VKSSNKNKQTNKTHHHFRKAIAGDVEHGRSDADDVPHDAVVSKNEDVVLCH
jgi:hypothetical protein